MMIKVVLLMPPPHAGLSKPHHYPKGVIRNAARRTTVCCAETPRTKPTRGEPIGTAPRTDPLREPYPGYLAKSWCDAAASYPSERERTSSRALQHPPTTTKVLDGKPSSARWLRRTRRRKAARDGSRSRTAALGRVIDS